MLRARAGGRRVGSAAHHRLVEELTGAIALVTETTALHGLITRRMREAANCDAIVLCTRQPARGAYVPVWADGTDLTAWTEAEFAEAGALVRWLRVNEDT